MGGEACRGVSVEKCEVGVCKCVMYVVPSIRSPLVCGLGVPRWMVGVEVTQDDGVTLGMRKELKGGGKVRRA